MGWVRVAPSIGRCADGVGVMTIPLIDISGFDGDDAEHRQEIADQWGAAFKTVGFASVAGHGISETLIESLYREAQSFFASPLAQKMEAYDSAARHQGYSPMGQEAVGRSEGGKVAPTDLCESIQFVDLHAVANRPAVWPAKLRPVERILCDFATEAAALERKLMRITALALDLDEDYFEPYYARMTTKLRLVNYPDQKEEPLPGQLRNAAHTDFGGFTILRQDDAPGGLQVRMPDGNWIDVTPVPATLVINAGDLIQRWTNDCFRSNLHRVINPPRGLTGSTQRLSIVVFTGPNPDTLIRCLPTCAGETGPKYPPIISSDHTRERQRLAYLSAAG